MIILTTYDLDEYVFEALEVGASGSLLKDVRPEDLVQGVRVVAAGECVVGSSGHRAPHRRVRRSDPERHCGTLRPPLGPADPREREVLGLMARGMSNAEIAGAAYVSENTVKTHVARIFDKLQLRDRAQAVIAAYEAGLVTPGSPDESPSPPSRQANQAR